MDTLNNAAKAELYNIAGNFFFLSYFLKKTKVNKYGDTRLLVRRLNLSQIMKIAPQLI